LSHGASSSSSGSGFASGGIAGGNNYSSNGTGTETGTGIGINGVNGINGINGTGTTPFPPFTTPHYQTPDSAPPSFHSRSSTPRPTPSTRTLASGISNISGLTTGSGVDLWGVATTTSGGTEIDSGEEGPWRGEGGSGLMVVKGLERRMERLEESIGRLLVSFSFLRSVLFYLLISSFLISSL